MPRADFFGVRQLTFAHQCEEIVSSPFKKIPNIGFQGNDKTVTIFKGQCYDSIGLPDWTTIHAVMESKFGGVSGIHNIPMEHFYGCQMWESHSCCREAGDLLSSLFSCIDDPSHRQFRTIVILEGHCIVPVETPGKRKGYFAFVGRLPHKIGLHIACGNGKNDKDMLTVVANLENGIAFWVGTAETKPHGANVFVVPNDDALSAILDELGELLPDRII